MVRCPPRERQTPGPGVAAGLAAASRWDAVGRVRGALGRPLARVGRPHGSIVRAAAGVGRPARRCGRVPRRAGRPTDEVGRALARDERPVPKRGFVFPMRSPTPTSSCRLSASPGASPLPDLECPEWSGRLAPTASRKWEGAGHYPARASQSVEASAGPSAGAASGGASVHASMPGVIVNVAQTQTGPQHGPLGLPTL